jgi:hypothetical protein
MDRETAQSQAPLDRVGVCDCAISRSMPREARSRVALQRTSASLRALRWVFSAPFAVSDPRSLQRIDVRMQGVGAILWAMLHWRAAASSFAGMVCSFAAFVHQASAADLANVGVCMREGAKIVGVTPVRVSEQVLPVGTTGRGVWMGELLAVQQGAVVNIWSIREFLFNPPFPPFNRAIEDAIRQWKFEPLTVKGQECRCA